MKSLVILVIGMLLGVGIMLFVPHGATQIVFAGSPSGNGDVNGSGKIDIADAVYLLAYLFAQGPAPEAIECTGGGVVATGQRVCYNTAGNVIDCTSSDWPGQDGFYQKGCPTADRYADNGDGTVTDNCTGLMWQKETAPGRYTWQQALQYCEGRDLAGHDDWRLPNVRELESIVDYGRWDPTIDTVFGAEYNWYWSSSTRADDPDYAWIVYFSDGHEVHAFKDSANYVRAVRDAR